MFRIPHQSYLETRHGFGNIVIDLLISYDFTKFCSLLVCEYLSNSTGRAW